MAFPSDPLPVSVWIAPGANPADESSWQWEEITSDVRVASGIHIEAGRGDEAGQVDPTKITLTIDNRSGDFSPRNPLGQWYGKLRRNTPLQVRVDRLVDTFTRVSGSGWGSSSNGFTWAHGAPANWSVSSNRGVVTFAAAHMADAAIAAGAGGDDVEVTWSTTLPVAAGGAAWVSAAALRYTDLDNFYRLHVEFQPAGVLQVKIQREVAGATTTLLGNLTVGSYAAGDKIWARARAEGPYLMIKAWKDGTTEPAAWQGVAQDTTLTGSGVGIYQWRVIGNTGSTTAYIDDVSTTAILATGTVAEWPVRWNRAATDCTTSITAAGILRRLQQGASPLRSPIYRQLSALSPQGYWPLEDGSDATAASSALTGGLVATGVDVTYGVDDAPPGAASSITLNTAVVSRLVGRVSRPSTTPDGYAGLVYAKLATIPPGTRTLIEFACTGRVARWAITADGVAWGAIGYDNDGAVVTNDSALYTVPPTEWTALQLETEEVGGTVNWQLVWHGVGDENFYAIGGSYTGTADRITGFTALAPESGTSFAHIWLGDNNLPFITSAFRAVSAGYAGELATERIARLCAEEGVPVTVQAGASQPMGPQRVDTFLSLLRAAEDADLGMLYERHGTLAYRPRGGRYNRPVTLALDFDAGDIAAPPEPVDDDQRIRNDWTISRDGGGTANVVDEEHVTAFGRYDSSATINVQDDGDLPHHAAWRVHLGTYDELRWPSIQLNLARRPTLIGQWLGMGLGDRITVANPPDQVAGDAIDLVLEGWTQTLRPYRWDVDLTCSPARPWDVGVYDSSVARYDSQSTTMASTVAAGVTSLPITTVLRADTWTTSDGPYNWLIAGEEVTVTAVTAPAGTGPYTQTATVVRAVNGIAKSLPAGAEVHLARPARYAL